jgi:hypothetical protein
MNWGEILFYGGFVIVFATVLVVIAVRLLRP